MRNLIQFIIRYNFVLLFLILETFALALLFQKNDYHRSWFVNTAQTFTGWYYERIGNANKYLGLRKVNLELARENTLLRNELDKAYKSEEVFFYSVHDSARRQRYYYTPARVINNSVNKRQNFLTLNKGSLDGIREEMGVISSKGVVGIVVGLSPHFSGVISLLNTDFRISAKLKKNDYFGSLSWPGRDYRYVMLSEIPHHVEVDVGDTVVTSGYSAIFPEGVLIGTVEDFSVTGGSFLEIRVKLSIDFRNVSHVEVVSNLRRDEQLELEKRISQ